MKSKPIEKAKKGDYFRMKETSPVYVADGYNRSTKKYSSHRFDDISSFKELNKGTAVITNFEF